MNNKKTAKYSVTAAVIAVVIIAGLATWLYTGKFNALKEKVLTIFPIPIALVNNHPIYLKDFSQRLTIASKLNTQNPPLDSLVLRQNVLDNVIEDRKLSLVSAKYGVSVGNKELNDEYNAIAEKADLPAGQNFSGLLKTYGLTEQVFKSTLLLPQLLTVKLNVWFNGQKNLNPDAYKTAEDLQSKIANGTDFGGLAKTYSQDPASQPLEGDMGFVLTSGLLPEISGAVDGMSAGQTKLLPSRYGLHIVKLLEKNNNGAQNNPQAHLSQIFIKTGGFEQWLDNETKNIKIKILINPVK